jgi:hypothetical protein
VFDVESAALIVAFVVSLNISLVYGEDAPKFAIFRKLLVSVV